MNADDRAATKVGVALLVASGMSPFAVTGATLLLTSLDGSPAAYPLGPWTRLVLGWSGR